MMDFVSLFYAMYYRRRGIHACVVYPDPVSVALSCHPASRVPEPRFPSLARDPPGVLCVGIDTSHPLRHRTDSVVTPKFSGSSSLRVKDRAPQIRVGRGVIDDHRLAPIGGEWRRTRAHCSLSWDGSGPRARGTSTPVLADQRTSSSRL